MSASLASFERPRIGVMNTVFKSGPLFISSRGIGWKSWKKRWFILTRTSLVFFKNDPSALPQKGGEVNLTLGGIDLNNSGSVVVREDKKLLTVLFPDGCEGRGFTLKAETSEDLFEWKTALENALSQAPSAALVMGQNGIFRSDTADTIENSLYQWRDKRSTKSLVVGRPILLALEDIDGSPSFLEKALRFLEKFGTKAEGILRLSADVEEVYLRVQEYERGKNEFSSLEDAHVIGDCVKHVLREMPSSPVPASCCTALLEAYRIEQKEDRVNALRSAILETFPEPNRRLLQRFDNKKYTKHTLSRLTHYGILKMMHTIAGHASENRMTASAVAACMAPLLLRPLLAGECELDDDFDMNGDNSAQLLAAANAANNAQAIVTNLLEEYDSIFNVDNLHRHSLSADSRIEIIGSEDSSNDETLATKDNVFHDAENEVAAELHDDPERIFSGKLSESSGYAGSDLYDNKAQVYGGDGSDAESSGENYIMERNKQSSKDPHKSSRNCSTQFNEQCLIKKGSENLVTEMNAPRKSPGISSQRSMAEILSLVDPGHTLPGPGAELCEETPLSKISVSNAGVKRSTFWGRNTARKTTSVESIDSSGEEELAIQRLEITKIDLHNRIAKEEKGNAILQASLKRRKQALHERRMALEQDVSRLQEQLQAERDLRAALEVGLTMSTEQFSSAGVLDSKTRAELEEIALAEEDVARLKQKVAELHLQLNQQRHTQHGSLSDACDRYQRIQNLHTQQKFHQQDFDTKLAFVYHGRKQKSEESSSGAEWGTVKSQALTSAHKGAQLPGKPVAEATSLSNSVSTGTSTNISVDELCAVDSASVPSTSKITEAMAYQRHPSTASSALIELTTRLDFFKERRNQLMEQLHSLDLNNELASSHSFAYKPSSPPWN